MAKEMGLDRAPIEFWKLVFLVPPNDYSDYNDYRDSDLDLDLESVLMNW